MMNMKKVVLSMFGVLFVSLFLIYGVTSANEIITNTDESFMSLNPVDVIDDSIISPFGFEGPTYPGTNTPLRVGDVLYSNKSFYGSSSIVGHVGIVGSDYRIYHVTPASDVNGGTGDGLYKYINRHGVNETITVYRHRLGYGVGAASWAENNYSRVTNYSIDLFSRLSTINPNYCSKFLWQAFYYGDGTDVTGKNIRDIEYTHIKPLVFSHYRNFAKITSFNTNDAIF